MKGIKKSECTQASSRAPSSIAASRLPSVAAVGLIRHGPLQTPSPIPHESQALKKMSMWKPTSFICRLRNKTEHSGMLLAHTMFSRCETYLSAVRVLRLREVCVVPAFPHRVLQTCNDEESPFQATLFPQKAQIACFGGSISAKGLLSFFHGTTCMMPATLQGHPRKRCGGAHDSPRQCTPEASAPAGTYAGSWCSCRALCACLTALHTKKAPIRKLRRCAPPPREGAPLRMCHGAWQPQGPPAQTAACE